MQQQSNNQSNSNFWQNVNDGPPEPPQNQSQGYDRYGNGPGNQSQFANEWNGNSNYYEGDRGHHRDRDRDRGQPGGGFNQPTDSPYGRGGHHPNMPPEPP